MDGLIYLSLFLCLNIIRVMHVRNISHIDLYIMQ